MDEEPKIILKKLKDLKNEYMKKCFPELKEAIDITKSALETLGDEVQELIEKMEDIQDKLEEAQNLKDELDEDF